MSKLVKVGEYTKKLNDITNSNLPLKDIFISDGLKKHIEGRHDDCLKYLEDIDLLKEFISEPDYVGKKKSNKDESIELIKIDEGNNLIAIKVDKKKDYIFVASIYKISDKKLNDRLKIGRLIKYE